MADSELDLWALKNVAANCTRKSMIDVALAGGSTLSDIYQSIGRAYITLKKNPWPHDGAVKLSFSMDEPNVIAVDNLLSQQECSQLVDLASSKVRRSTVLEGTSSVVHSARTSSHCAVYDNESAVVTEVNNRIAEKFNWPQADTEAMQIVRYNEHEQYLPHNDYFSASNVGVKQRVATLLIYLQEPEEGGSTYFPESGMHFYPKVGSAILFTYAGIPTVSKTLHGGSPVLRGTKYVATKWFKTRE